MKHRKGNSMRNNIYEIRSGAITVYVGSWNGKDFSFKGFTVENDPINYGDSKKQG
jgi:hypothetical protein